MTTREEALRIALQPADIEKEAAFRQTLAYTRKLKG